MSDGPRYYCWHCYAESSVASGACARCGRAVQGPPDVTYQDRLIWALQHPLPDRQLMAATLLGKVGDDRAASRLRELVYDRDPYLAAAALRSFVTIVGLRSRGLLVEAAATAAAPVRRTARELLAQQSEALEREGPRSA